MKEDRIPEGVQMFADFAKMAETDEELKAKLDEIGNESDELDIAPKLIRLGEEYGFHFSETDIGHYLGQRRELTSGELEMVNGGCSDNSTASGLGKIIGQWAKTKCFTADSLVATPDGPKSIRDIRVGDKVLSLDTEGKGRTATVTDIMESREMPVIRVLFENGKEWLTTDTQWFYCGGDDYACVKDAGGKKAITAEGECSGVASVEETGRIEMVYDFVVDTPNVFFVNGIAAEGFSLS